VGRKFCSRCVSEEDEGEGSPLSEQSQGRSASLNRARGLRIGYLRLTGALIGRDESSFLLMKLSPGNGIV
jgi:hypothetical protein